MTCPNCGREVRDAADLDTHADRCVLAVLAAVLIDRGHDLAGADLEGVNDDYLWHAFAGPAADFLAEQLGFEPYPATEEQP